MRTGLIVAIVVLLITNVVLMGMNLRERQKMAPVLDQMYQDGLGTGLQLRPPPK